MRIGISVLTHEGQNIWANGLGQNVFHLARLMRALPFVQDVILINCGDRPAFSVEAAPGVTEFALVTPQEATERLDVVIEMSGGLNVEWLDLMRARGAKVVFHICGQPYAALVEPTVFGVSGYFSRPDRCDAVWVLPKDRPFIPMLEALHRCPVFETPFIWNAAFLEQRIKDVSASGLSFGFNPSVDGQDRKGLRAAIFEPNISVTKTSTIPMLICDEAYRRNRAAISEMRILNSVQLRDHPTFTFLNNSLDLTRDGKTVLDQRHDFPSYMAQHADLVVTHHWDNPQNILYLDALWGGYPLVHNSPWLGDVGYFYPESDTVTGARQILTAWAEHAVNLSSYRAKADRFLATLNPLNQANKTAYARRLLHLVADDA